MILGVVHFVSFSLCSLTQVVVFYYGDDYRDVTRDNVRGMSTPYRERG